MKSIAIIPARYDSQRLPQKLLLKLGGIPIICRVWQNISKSKKLNKVIVATDDERISNELELYGIPYVMTSKDLPSGTDRICSALNLINESADIVVNVQGDEPFLEGSHIDLLLDKFNTSDFDVATFITKINDTQSIINPNVVKVVLGERNNALYFSRSSVPYLRDFPIEQWLEHNSYWKHIGIYAYKIDAINTFSKLPVSNLERIEKLEQLRLLEYGYKYQCVTLVHELISIDTIEDYELAKTRFD